MSASKAAYLASKYGTADPILNTKKSSRKRKRAAVSSSSNNPDDANAASLVIADDDGDDELTGWNRSRVRKGTDGDDGDEAGRSMVVVAGRSADFKKKKSSGWTKVATGADEAVDGADGADEADQILWQVELERRRRAGDDAQEVGDEAPVEVVVQQKQQQQQQPEEQQVAEKKTKRKKKKDADDEAPTTIYRDASGRIINVERARIEAERRKEEDERKKREEEKQARGDIQNQMRDEERQRLKDAKYLTFARSKDDVEMNDEMKKEIRWADPARGFLTKPKAEPGSKSRRRTTDDALVELVYSGGFEPNRYGIKPGFRWDGVNRSTGFEKLWFAARNKKRDIEERKYTSQMDDD